MFVLNSFCDDYEDIERITNHKDEVGPKCGLTISHDDIIQALRELIELGHAKAWDLGRWPDPATEHEDIPPREDITPLNPRFVRTEEGMAFQKARSATWPFDQDHNPRESWLPSEPLLNREELVRFLVLDSFRNCTRLSLRHVELHWKRLPERYGITISRNEIIQALRALIGLGHLIAVYRDEYWQYAGMPLLEDIKPFCAYFWLTDVGSDFHNANDPWWPFDVDDDGELHLRADWAPPDV
jgi:hypothetical protein